MTRTIPRKHGVIVLIGLVGAVAIVLHDRQHRPTAPPLQPEGQRNADSLRASPLERSVPTVKRLASQAAVEDLRSAIAVARMQRQRTQRPIAGSTAALAPSSPAATDPIDPIYVRAAVKDIVPLLAECFDRALERDAKLAGTVVVKFTIVGEPSVGGMIDDSAIKADGTTIDDAQMRECVQETMYAIRIDPPQHGVIIEVEYPFAFSPEGR